MTAGKAARRCDCVLSQRAVPLCNVRRARRSRWKIARGYGRHRMMLCARRRARNVLSSDKSMMQFVRLHGTSRNQERTNHAHGIGGKKCTMREARWARDSHLFMGAQHARSVPFNACRRRIVLAKILKMITIMRVDVPCQGRFQRIGWKRTTACIGARCAGDAMSRRSLSCFGGDLAFRASAPACMAGSQSPKH